MRAAMLAMLDDRNRTTCPHSRWRPYEQPMLTGSGPPSPDRMQRGQPCYLMRKHPS